MSPLALSFLVAGVATAVALVLGVAVAAALVRPRTPGRDLFGALIMAPMVLPPTVLGYYVLIALGRRSALGQAYEDLTGNSIVFTRTGAIIAATIGALPLVVRSARAGLAGVDPTLLRAARTLGAGPLRRFFTIELPLAWPGVLSGLMLAFAHSLGDFGVTLMVAGDIPGETQTASLAIYDAVQANRDRDAVGMILVLTAIGIGALYAVNKLARGRGARD